MGALDEELGWTQLQAACDKLEHFETLRIELDDFKAVQDAVKTETWILKVSAYRIHLCAYSFCIGPQLTVSLL